MALRYRELCEGGPTEKGDYLGFDEPPFEIDSSLAAIDTSRIDSEYMEEKSKKWIRTVLGGLKEAQEETLNALHSEFRHLSAEDQGFANRVIDLIQMDEIVVDDKTTLRDPIDFERERVDSKNKSELVKAFGICEQLIKRIDSAT